MSDHVSPFLLQDPHVFETLFNAALDAWAIADDRGNYLDANPAACQLFGLPRCNLIGCHLRDFTFQGFDFASAWQQFLDQGQDKGEFQLIRTDGQVYEVEYTAKAKVISGYHLLMWRDVTARKRAEDRVQVLENLLAQTTAVPPPSHPDSLEAMQKTDEERYRLQQIARHIPGAIYQLTLHLDGRSCFPYFSEGLQEIYGVAPEAVREDATPLLAMIHPDDLASFKRSIVDSATHLNPWHCEYRICHPDGRLLWAIGHATPQRELDGSTIWYGYIQDITAQKATDQALRENHVRLQLALEAANIGTWDWNPQTNQVAFSKQWKAMLGYKEDEIENRLPVWESLVHPEDLQEAYAKIDAHIQGKTPVYQNEYRMRCKDASYKWILDRGQIIERDEQGQPVRFIGIHHDISERKTAELALRELTQQLQKAQEVAQLGYTYFDMATQKITWSEQVFRIFGLNPDQGEPTFKEYLKKLHPQDRTIWQQRLTEARQGVPQSFDYRVFRPDGEMRYVNARLELEVRDGEVVGIFGTEMDITDRKTAELELEQFFSISLDLLCIADAEGRFRRLNRAWETSLGYTVEELAGRLFLEFVHPDDVAPTLAKMSDLEHGDRVLKFVNRYRAKDGSYRYIEWLANPCGSLIYAAARDITDRIQTEATLRANEEKLRSLFDLSPLGIVLNDMQGKFTEANPAALNITGYTLAELNQLSYWDLTPSEYIQPQNRQIQLLKTIGRYGPYQKEYIRKNGDRVPVELTGMIVTGADGQQYVWSIIADITERKQAEAQLNEISERLSLSLKSGAIGCWEWNIIENTLIWDDRMYELYGVNPESNTRLVYEIWSTGLHPDDREASESLIRQTVLGQAEFDTEFRVIHPDGSIHFIKAFGLLLRNPEGNPEKMIGVNFEITDRKQAEAQLQSLLQESQAKSQELQLAYRELQETQIQLIQAEKMSSLGQLVAGVAHEINNPVSFIYGNLTPTLEYAQSLLELIQLYQDCYPNPGEEITDFSEEIELDFIIEDFPKIIDSMKNGASRIRDIVKSLRIFSRLDEADLKEVDLHENLDSTLVILHNRLNGGGVNAEIKVIKNYGKLPLVECYIGLLNQVFMNLLINGIQAIEERQKFDLIDLNYEYVGIITITTAIDASNWVSISIKDNGIGMTPEVQANIFNPFFTTKPVGQGTGMGLPNSYQIVTKNHQGKLSFTSAIGVGSEFVIQLPCR
ncbi:PAS domain S-box protein [Planktothricoides sp. SR001]|uniref:PAS domain S-box protein n=1 Tax=Planktothricoides sp. SR001 TaxID=1705388 RepID=UPI0006C8771E|nr:PAS domain S-box protein [Planktothricoides sp. SR001]